MSKESYQLSQQACKLESQSNLEGAVNLVRQAINLSPNESILYTKLAGLYADLGDYNNALGAYKAAIKLRPNDAFIYISIGNILQTTGDLENAYASYMQAMEIFPSYKYNYLNLANVLLAQGKYTGAIEYYNLFLAAYPEQASAKENLANAYLYSGKYSLACKNYAAALRANSESFREYANYGYALFEEKQYSQAVEMFKTTLMETPDNIKARADLAVSYHMLGKLELSKQHFEQIFKLKPDLTSLRIYYANLLSDIKLYDEAIEQYSTYLKAYPNDADAYKLLALVYKNQGKDDLAIKNLLASLSKNNKDIEVKKELAFQYHKKNDYQDAIKYYDEILNETPDNYDIMANKALALHALKKYDEAITIYENILSKKPNERLKQNLVSAYISKGDYLLTQSKFKDAIPPFEFAILKDSNQSYAYYGLAKAYEMLNNYDLALVNYEKALQIEPDKELYLKDYNEFKSANQQKDEIAQEVKDEVTFGLPKPVNIKTVVAGGENKNESMQQKELASLDNLMIQKPAEQIDDKVKNLIKEGDALYKSGHNTEAVDKYTEALKLSPNDSITAFKIANLYKLENNVDKSITYYKKAIAINKNYSEALFNLGLVYGSKNDYKNCKDCFNKVISLSPDYAYAYYALALAYEKEGNIDYAISNYQKYCNLEKDDLTKKAVQTKIEELQKLNSTGK